MHKQASLHPSKGVILPSSSVSPDMIIHIMIYNYHKSTQQGFPLDSNHLRDWLLGLCKVVQKLQKGLFCLSALQDLNKLY